MKKYIIFFALFLTGCGTANVSTLTPTATPNAGEIALSMMQSQLEANATAQQVGLQFTATAQIMAQTATAQQIVVEAGYTQQARMDAQATADQKRADAQATQMRMDAEATQARERRDQEIQATQMRLDIESTQQAQATANSFSMTQQVAPTHNFWTQQAVEQQIVIATNEVELSNLAVKQQQQTNTIEWAVPFSIALILAVAAVIYILRFSRVREFKNDNGDLEGVIVDGDTVVRMDLFPTPVLQLKDMTMPQLAAPADQRAVTERAQAIKALAAMPAQTTSNAAAAYSTYFSQNKEKPYDIVDVNSMPPAGLLDPEALKSIESDWKEATDGQ
mgnify:CR=1 FL=1